MRAFVVFGVAGSAGVIGMCVLFAEEMWSALKAAIRAQQEDIDRHGRTDPHVLIANAMKEMTPEKCQKWIHHSGYI